MNQIEAIQSICVKFSMQKHLLQLRISSKSEKCQNRKKRNLLM